mmetsp:Transcript_15886/g.23593  ORF Transcript_15886/g.23593 Transcript_15886/m.23593 type:complete len:246 (-) Transcript_15886:87-824(-)
MNRNQYDTDVSTWSPQGKLHQVEYAMESVKQGSCSLGLRNKDYVVLAALKRSTGELSSYQKKIFKIDDHIGIGIAGLTADARALATYMRTECLNHKFQFDSPIITGRMVSDLADKHQAKTQASWKRPYGVGMLVAGYDRDGPHLYQTCPSGNLYEYKAMAIGARAQSAKTYLEKHLESYPGADLEQLIMHALKALEGPASDKDVAVENATVAVVGKNQPFQVLEGDELKPYLDKLESQSGSMETD